MYLLLKDEKRKGKSIYDLGDVCTLHPAGFFTHMHAAGHTGGYAVGPTHSSGFHLCVTPASHMTPPSCVTLGKLFKVSKTVFSHLKTEITTRPHRAVQ